MRRMETKEYRSTEYGEFEFIEKKMYSVNAIRKAHQTPLTKNQTYNLLKVLSKRYFKDENMLKLRWITRGRWNLGGIDIIRGKKIPIIELYAIKENKKKGIYGLRAGIVLHEFSHALANYNSRRVLRGEGHGREFIKTFNKVLKFYNKNVNIKTLNLWKKNQ